MTEQQRIDDYADQFARHLVASHAERMRRRAELVGHLSDAAEVGELTEALRRLGRPEVAARSFAPARSRGPAPPARRFAAAAVDNLPLIGVTLALFVGSVARVSHEGGLVAAIFPPILHAEFGGVCVTLAPAGCAGDLYAGAGRLYTVGIPLAVAWSILGLGILESRTGTTPGKWLLRLLVTTEAGLRVRPSVALLRRTSFLAGPLAWLDWAPLLWGERRRLLDRVTRTKVVADDR
jgi:uncharacterized RDD family membrane protein YckC